MLVYLDIETTSLKASEGMVVAVGLLRGEKPEVRFAGTPAEEKSLLEWLRRELEGCDALVTWNGSGFDIPFLLTRAVFHGVDLHRLLEVPMLDLYEWCRGHLLLSSYKLEAVGRFLGVDRTQMFHGGDVLTLFKLAEGGNFEARRLIVEHCREDLILLRHIHGRLRPQFERPGQGSPRRSSTEG